MFISEVSQITRKEARYFLEPANATHRQYEALRAYFVEALPSAEAARRGGYTPAARTMRPSRFIRPRMVVKPSVSFSDNRPLASLGRRPPDPSQALESLKSQIDLKLG